ncbi:MAG: hypothetical protein ACKVON_02450, partial [Beijerinckiaceae bacterium]
MRLWNRSQDSSRLAGTTVANSQAPCGSTPWIPAGISAIASTSGIMCTRYSEYEIVPTHIRAGWRSR